MKSILVTGANGQLGSELRFLAQKLTNFKWIFTDVEDLDITSSDAVNALFEAEKPTFCINAAAYTAVDKAETAKDLCYQINEDGPKCLIAAAKKSNTIFFQISSDYVYHNEVNFPIPTNSETNPQGAYAASKLAGDVATLNYDNGHVVRTSWVYSSYGHNFVKTMIKLGSDRDQLTIVDDQIGTPTYARDLAAALIEWIVGYDNLDLPEMIHYSNEGVCSWYDFALAIFEIKSITCNVKPIPSSSYPTPAARPHYSVLDKIHTRILLQDKIPHWRSALNACLQAIQSNEK